MSYQDHLKSSAETSVRCAIVTFSDTRTADNDTSGRRIADLLTAASHPVVEHLILKENPVDLHPAIWRLIQRGDLDAILTTGGTGISRRDQAVAIVEKLIDQPLPGFGELFRQLSYAQIGSGAMLSRAVAGIAQGKLMFALPGSTAAVDLAMTQLILPEIRHLVGELRK